jgi:hypothetical protein
MNMRPTKLQPLIGICVVHRTIKRMPTSAGKWG